MAIYEYRCNQCNQVFEKHRSLMYLKEPCNCSYCGAENTYDNLVISLNHFQFSDGLPSYKED